MEEEFSPKMTDAEFARIKHGLSSVLHKACVSCGYSGEKLLSRWLLADVIHDAEGKRFVNPQLGPNIKLVCKNCGNVQYFDASKVGLERTNKGRYFD